jgi:subtilisin-like proprotein convertase family protein
MKILQMSLACICTAVLCTAALADRGFTNQGQPDGYAPDGGIAMAGCPLPPCPDALDEGEPCGSDTNGGCNSVPPIFTDAACGDNFLGNAWALGGTRDTDWYILTHGGGPITAKLTSQFEGVCFIVGGVGPGGVPCAPAVLGDIGCANNCANIAIAGADVAPGTIVVFVATGLCSGGGIFDGYPCGGGNNDYCVEIACEEPITGACCLPDGSCVDGKTQEECEEPPSPGCGDCDTPHPWPGCTDPVCEALVCAQDSYCCAVQWDSICVGEALDKCDCGPGGWGGEFHEGVTCADNPCVPTGACCYCDENNDPACVEVTEEECAALYPSKYIGDGEPCQPGGEIVYYAASPGLPIPDCEINGASHSIVVTDSGPIQDLNVDVGVAHTWYGDLCVMLSKDGGPEITLIKRMNLIAECDVVGCCGCSANNFNVILDDEAASSIEDQCAADLSGSYYPDPDSLDYFDGMDAAGTWTMRINDNACADAGVFVKWSLEIELPGGGPGPCDDWPGCAEPRCLIIKQGACPAPVNPGGHGVTPMLLVGEADFDAGSVILDSLALERCDGVGGVVMPYAPHTKLKDLNHPFLPYVECGDGRCACNDDQSSDGIMDLSMKFKTAEMAEILGLGSLPMDTVVQLVLTGETTDGKSFEAVDCIRIVGGGGGYGGGGGLGGP